LVQVGERFQEAARHAGECGTLVDDGTVSGHDREVVRTPEDKEELVDGLGGEAGIFFSLAGSLELAVVISLDFEVTEFFSSASIDIFDLHLAGRSLGLDDEKVVVDGRMQGAGGGGTF